MQSTLSFTPLTKANPILVEQTKTHIDDDIEFKPANALHNKGHQEEILELRLYSTIWFAAAAGLLNRFVFQAMPNKVAIALGAAIPRIMDDSKNLTFHYLLSRYLLHDSTHYERDQGTGTKAPVSMVEGGL